MIYAALVNHLRAASISKERAYLNRMEEIPQQLGTLQARINKYFTRNTKLSSG